MGNSTSRRGISKKLERHPANDFSILTSRSLAREALVAGARARTRPRSLARTLVVTKSFRNEASSARRGRTFVLSHWRLRGDRTPRVIIKHFLPSSSDDRSEARSDLSYPAENSSARYFEVGRKWMNRGGKGARPLRCSVVYESVGRPRRDRSALRRTRKCSVAVWRGVQGPKNRAACVNAIKRREQLHTSNERVRNASWTERRLPRAGK